MDRGPGRGTPARVSDFMRSSAGLDLTEPAWRRRPCMARGPRSQHRDRPKRLLQIKQANTPPPMLGGHSAVSPQPLSILQRTFPPAVRCPRSVGYTNTQIRCMEQNSGADELLRCFCLCSSYRISAGTNPGALPRWYHATGGGGHLGRRLGPCRHGGRRHGRVAALPAAGTWVEDLRDGTACCRSARRRGICRQGGCRL